MIKGVNKQVLEINETNSEYFEKAVFFVKPEYSGFSEGKLRECARREVSDAGVPPGQKHFSNENKWKKAIGFAAFTLAGVILGIVISLAF